MLMQCLRLPFRDTREMFFLPNVNQLARVDDVSKIPQTFRNFRVRKHLLKLYKCLPSHIVIADPVLDEGDRTLFVFVVHQEQQAIKVRPAQVHRLLNCPRAVQQEVEGAADRLADRARGGGGRACVQRREGDDIDLRYHASLNLS